MTFMKNKVYYAGDGLPLRPGDVVTGAPDAPSTKHAYRLLRGVVVDRAFGAMLGDDPACHVIFEESTSPCDLNTIYVCRMKHLAHLSLPSFDETKFFTMLEVNR